MACDHEGLCGWQCAVPTPFVGYLCRHRAHPRLPGRWRQAARCSAVVVARPSPTLGRVLVQVRPRATWSTALGRVHSGTRSGAMTVRLAFRILFVVPCVDFLTTYCGIWSKFSGFSSDAAAPQELPKRSAGEVHRTLKLPAASVSLNADPVRWIASQRQMDTAPARAAERVALLRRCGGCGAVSTLWSTSRRELVGPRVVWAGSATGQVPTAPRHRHQRHRGTAGSSARAAAASDAPGGRGHASAPPPGATTRGARRSPGRLAPAAGDSAGRSAVPRPAPARRAGRPSRLLARGDPGRVRLFFVDGFFAYS